MIYISLAFLLLIAVVINNAALAVLLGIFFSLVYKPNTSFISRKISTIPLQIGIVFLGFTISANYVLDIGTKYFLWITLFVLLSFFGGLFLSRLFNLNKNLSILLSAGAAICGGTAIAAIAPIIKAKPEELILSLTIIFIFNTIALLTFPFIGSALGMSSIEFGSFAALAVHDTSSVVGTALEFSSESVEVAATLKLGRTLWLIPLILLLNYKNKTNSRNAYPKFILFFIIAIIANTFLKFSYETILSLRLISQTFLMVGLFCIGTQSASININMLTLKPISFSLTLWILAIPSAYFIVTVI